MTAIMKVMSNVKKCHSFGLRNEGAAVVGGNWGCGEDGVRGVSSSDHLSRRRDSFIAFGRVIEKEQSILNSNARGVEWGGGVVALTVDDEPQRTWVDSHIGVLTEQLVVGIREINSKLS